MILLAIDPGTSDGCGWSSWDNGILTRAEFAKLNSKIANDVERWVSVVDYILDDTMTVDPNQLVIELPVVYVRSRSKGDPNGLIQLAFFVGMCVDRAAGKDMGVTIYKPREWKGNLPKEVHHPRIQSKLSPDELAAVKLPKNQKHCLDVWDAVGIGMFHLQKIGARK